MGVDHLIDVLNRYQTDFDEFLGCQMISSYVDAFLLVNVRLGHPVTLFFPPNETIEYILETLTELGLAGATFQLSVYQYQGHISLDY